MAVSKRSKCMGQKCASARYDPTSSRVMVDTFDPSSYQLSYSHQQVLVMERRPEN